MGAGGDGLLMMRMLDASIAAMACFGVQLQDGIKVASNHQMLFHARTQSEAVDHRDVLLFVWGLPACRCADPYRIAAWI